MKKTRIIQESATHEGETPTSVVFVKCDVCRRKTISFSIAPAEDVTRRDPEEFIHTSLLLSGWFIRDGMHVCSRCDSAYRR